VYNVSYKCTSFLAGIGSINASATGSQARNTVGLDGVDVTLATSQGAGT
jgi:hypothetical protein